MMAWRKRLLAGGSTGNGQLTAVVAAVLLALLAIEGATLLQIRALLTVHAFVGMLLIPVVSLKLASTGWRMLGYYRRSEEYVRLGPPPIVLRAIFAPVLMLSTLVLFATGTALLVLGQTEGTIVGLHKASFIVWFGAAGVHVLAHVTRLPRLLRARATGAGVRVALATGAVAVGALLAIATLPSVDRLQDRASAHVSVDSDEAGNALVRNSQR
jgi:succinate dehydrogenase/fumarate reductase flavoprotein subunit